MTRVGSQHHRGNKAVIVQFAVTKPRRQLLESRPGNTVPFEDVSGVLILFHPARLP
jgi:hypothetical protein